MTTVKTVQANYTPEQVIAITAAYVEGESLETIAASVGKTIPSVRAKLSALKVYVSKAKKADNGENKETKVNKDGLKAYLESLVGSDLLNIEAASKNALVILINAIKARDEKISALIADMLGEESSDSSLV